mmetsp:Transcript_11807/g.35900  ORF Transcript_11807/g.35900 Transcript_11807/m.35900 type:complete len:200 (+) Transcript_11807:1775-2374(+)
MVMFDTSSHLINTLPTLQTRFAPAAPPRRRSLISAMATTLALKTSDTSADVISISPDSPMGMLPAIAPSDDEPSLSMIQLESSSPHAETSMLLKAFRPTILIKFLASAAKSELQLVGMESRVLSSGAPPATAEVSLMAPSSSSSTDLPRAAGALPLASARPALTSSTSASLTISCSVQSSAMFLTRISREFALSRSTPS